MADGGRSSELERVRDRLRSAAGSELVERLTHLDRVRAEATHRDETALPPDRGAHVDFDVVIAGGGLSSLYAPVLSHLGLSVLVVDRARVGAAHREWNASRRELSSLVEAGVASLTELDDELIVARYDRGVCRWHGGGEYPVHGVLDCAVDAQRLLSLARQRGTSRGVEIRDATSVVAMSAGRDAVSVILARDGMRETVTAKIVIDARGASSPYASADLVCPTVGGIFSGLAAGDDPGAVNPEVGEILVTTEGIEDGHQHLWETFPGASSRATVYLFYYAPRSAETNVLLRLYARMFERLGGYKRGDAKLESPTFGFIPGWSRLTPPPRSPSPRIVLVGDAAARHSPLTFCGFGSTLRSLRPVSRHIAELLEHGIDRSLVDDAPVHVGTGALSLLLSRPPLAPARDGELNELLDAAFASLYALGDEAYAALLRDESSLSDFVSFLRATAKKRPRVYFDFVRAMGIGPTLRWAARLGLNLRRELG